MTTYMLCPRLGLRLPVLLTVLALTSGAVFAGSDTDGWTLERDKAGVKVYTRSIEGWSLKEYKAVVQIRATLAQVESALRDAPNRCKWIHNSYNTKDVKTISQNEIYTYCAIDAPWPVSDRDNVVHWKFNRLSDKEIRIDMNCAAEVYPEQSSTVRIKRLKGYWKLVDLGNGYVEVTQQVASEPGGSIPAWLANSSIVDTPFNTLFNLKQYVENKNGVLIKN